MKLKQDLKLRKWQETAFDLWISNSFNGIFSVATGGGKTIFAIYCLAHLLKKNIIDKIYVVVPTKTLQEQWAANFISISDISMREISFKNKVHKKINILTNISAQRLSDKVDYSNSCGVFDECHRYGTDKHIKIFELPFKSKIGLTATLERKYDDGVERIIKPGIGEIIFDYDMKAALNDGVIENFEMINIKTHLNSHELYEYDQFTEKISKRIKILQGKKYTDYEIQNDPTLKNWFIQRKNVVNDSEQRAYAASRIILDNLNRKKIIFCESINQAHDIYNELSEKKLESTLYHSRLKRMERIQNLSSFQKNYFHTLIGCKALDEGFDVPDIDFAIIVSQSNTSRQRIQRLGRTVRKQEGKNKPIIYTLYTTDSEYDMLYSEMMMNPQIKVKWIVVK